MSMPFSLTPGELLAELAHIEPEAGHIDALLSRPHAERLMMQLADEPSLGELTLRVPAGFDRQSSWLAAIGDRAKALSALAARSDHQAAGARRLSEALSALVSGAVSLVASHPALLAHGREASEILRAHPGLEPWQSVAAATLPEGPLDQAVAAQLIDAWLGGELLAPVASALRQRVYEGEAQAVYVQAVRARLSQLVYEVNAAPTTRIPFWTVALPHLGDEACASAELVPSGLRLRWPGAEPVTVPLETTAHVWPNDALLGRCETALSARWLGELESAESALSEAQRVAFEAERPDAPARAERIADWLRSPALLEALSQAAQAVTREARDEDEELTRWVLCAVGIREALDVVAGETLDPALIACLEEADVELSKRRVSLQLLSAEQLELVTSGDFDDESAWWYGADPITASVDLALDALRDERRKGVRPPVDAELAQRVAKMFGALSKLNATLAPPTPAVAQLAATSPKAAAPVAYAAESDVAQRIRQLAKSSNMANDHFHALMDALGKTACPWLRSDVHKAIDELQEQAKHDALLGTFVPVIAQLVQPQPGRVAVLAAVAGLELASVWELRITRREGGDDPWQSAPMLREVARDAVRTAYFAVASLLGGCAPLAFDEHAFSLVGSGEYGIQAIDGASLGLAAAIAFASLWARQAPAADVSASARLHVGRDGSVALLPVGHLAAKAEALSRLGGPQQTLLVARDNLAQASSAVVLQSPSSLREAVEQAGISLAKLSPSSWAGRDEEARRHLLATMSNHVDVQHLDPYRGRGQDEPWAVLADRMRQLIDMLSSSREPDTEKTVAEARPRAALAFSHVMDGEAASAVLGETDVATLLPEAAFLVHIVRLGGAIDDEDWDGCERASSALVELEPQLREPDRRRLLGLSLGARGRAQMHRRQLSVAIPLLAAAVEHHRTHSERERPRSRIYLAMAHRMAGDVVGALEQLTQATIELDDCLRVAATYAAQTSVFLRYEQARCLLAAGLADKAAEVAREAILLAERTGSFWPLIGLQRTLAWALRALGDDAAADVEVDAIARSGAPAKLLAPLVDEARGHQRTDGLVY